MSKFAVRSVSRADVRQFARYFAAGTSYFWMVYIVFAVCYSGLHWAWWPAKMLGDAAGWTLSYFLQRYWAFASSGLKKREEVTLAKYVALTMVNFAIDYGIVGGLRAMGVSPYLGTFVSAGFFTVWNYVWFRFWVFLGKAPARQTGQKEGA